jgi:fatty-acyl-CoA synthase
VLAAAVVAQPDEKWGETPCAFVELKEGANIDAEELTAFCRPPGRLQGAQGHLLRPLPKTSTGKIQKFELRKRMKSDSAINV